MTDGSEYRIAAQFFTEFLAWCKEQEKPLSLSKQVTGTIVCRLGDEVFLLPEKRREQIVKASHVEAATEFLRQMMCAYKPEFKPSYDAQVEFIKRLAPHCASRGITLRVFSR